ncbi:waterproof [Carabus blaptoides fortunei]
MKIAIFLLLTFGAVLGQDTPNGYQQHPIEAQRRSSTSYTTSIVHGDKDGHAQSSVKVNLNSAHHGLHQPAHIQPYTQKSYINSGMTYSQPDPIHVMEPQHNQVGIQYQQDKLHSQQIPSELQYRELKQSTENNAALYYQGLQQQSGGAILQYHGQNPTQASYHQTVAPKNNKNSSMVTLSQEHFPANYIAINHNNGPQQVQVYDQGDKPQKTKVYSDIRNTHGYTWKNLSPGVEISGYHSIESPVSNEQPTQVHTFDHAAALGRSQGFDMSNVVDNGKVQYHQISTGESTETQSSDITKTIAAPTSNIQYQQQSSSSDAGNNNQELDINKLLETAASNVQQPYTGSVGNSQNVEYPKLVDEGNPQYQPVASALQSIDPQLMMINQHYAFAQAQGLDSQQPQALNLIQSPNNDVKPVKESQEDYQGDYSEQKPNIQEANKQKDEVQIDKPVATSHIYEGMKKSNPEFRKSIMVCEGDCSEEGLGLSLQDRHKIISEVTMVFHLAATVRFDEKLKLATKINLQGTKELLDLCKEFENLQVILHCSTAYSNCIRAKIEEKIYEPVRDPEEFLDYVNRTSAEELDNCCAEIIGKYPNTYTFTKSLAEEIVRRHMKSLPIVLYRPSIVIGTYQEPIAGWTNGISGISGLSVGTGAGILRVIRVKNDSKCDLIPADMVVNSILATAWQRGQTNGEIQPEVLNFVSSTQNPLTWREYLFWNMEFGRMYPLCKTIWYYVVFPVESYFQYLIYTFFLHTIPGYIIDAALLIQGKKPILRKIYAKIDKMSTLLQYFSTRQWEWDNGNIQQLWNRMDYRDQLLFQFDVNNIKWDEILLHQIKSLRQFVLKDPMSTCEMARKRLAKLKVVHYGLISTIVGLFACIMYVFVFKYFL